MPATVALPAIAVVELATVACGVSVICATLEPEASFSIVRVLAALLTNDQSSPASSDSSADSFNVAASPSVADT